MHPLKEILQKRKNGIKTGIPSYCSANEMVIEVALERAKETNTPVLIESTANQVNQFGGYTNMKPREFMDFVLDTADKVGCPHGLIVLAGDHLGPLTWCEEPEETAMEKAEELVRQYVAAGFTKIHLDTSMKLGDDATDKPLSTETVARRGVRLYKVCMQAYHELVRKNPDALRPVFVIGSEVPIPGGAQEVEERISVTKPEDFVETVDTYKKIFAAEGMDEAWNDVIAVVVQPGVEFGDGQVFLYNRENAASLCEKLKEYPEIVFEGHSTDYQSPDCLRKMVEDGIAILKVGPALTFALREGLFSLSMIEREMIPEGQQSGFIECLERDMVTSPDNWKKHYHGNGRQLAFARKYSFSDRARYYLGDKAVVDSIEHLFSNLRDNPIPLNILSQYMPLQYQKVMEGKLSLDPRELVKYSILKIMQDYEYAAGRKCKGVG